MCDTCKQKSCKEDDSNDLFSVLVLEHEGLRLFQQGLKKDAIASSLKLAVSPRYGYEPEKLRVVNLAKSKFVEVEFEVKVFKTLA